MVGTPVSVPAALADAPAVDAETLIGARALQNDFVFIRI